MSELPEFLSEIPADIRAVLWDMDGTLVDSEPLHLRTFEAALQAQGITPPPNLHEITLGKHERASYEVLVNDLGLTLDYPAWTALRYRLYLDGAPGLRVIPSAKRLWDKNAAQGLEQAIVSNSDRMVVDANLRAAGVASGGMVSISRNDVKAGKPDPEPYLRAAWLLGVDPAQAAVIEDSATGVAAGLAAEMRVFFVRNPMLQDHPQATPIFDLD